MQRIADDTDPTPERWLDVGLRCAVAADLAAEHMGMSADHIRAKWVDIVPFLLQSVATPSGLERVAANLLTRCGEIADDVGSGAYIAIGRDGR